MNRIPLEAGFSTTVQSSTGDNPATRTVGTGPLLGLKRPGRGVDHQPPLTPRIKEEYSYTTTRPPLYLQGRLWGELNIYTHMSITVNRILKRFVEKGDRLCGLVVRVSGYRYRGPGFDSRHYQIF